MKTITKADLTKIRSNLALHALPEDAVSYKWEQVSSAMGTVPMLETVRGLKIVLFLVKKAEVIMTSEVALRGSEGTFVGFEKIETIKNKANELLAVLEG